MALSKHVDGRRLRTERSKEAVARAVLDLIAEGDLQPTAAAIAERADVSLRLVHHHFADRDALFRAASRLQNLRTAALIRPIDTSATLDERLDNFVKQRARVYEAITPVRRATLANLPSLPSAKSHLGAFRKLKRAQLVEVFSDEIATHSASERRELIAALSCAASWSAWEELRVSQGLSIRAARGAVRRMLARLLDAPEPRGRRRG